MTAPMATSLPYGIKDCKLTPYADAGGTILGGTSIDLPNMQTFSFSDTEEFTELRGDDKVITTRGQGAQVEWELESGGISLKAWAVFSGGQVIESGSAPNRTVTLRKFAGASRPFFRVEGQAVSDSGGDLHTIVYRCRCNDSIEGQFADGEFWATSVSGLGLPLVDADFDLLYDFIQNEQVRAISNTPLANPLGVPAGLVALSIISTGFTLDWNDVDRATGYTIQKSTDAGSTWVAGPADVTVSQAAVTQATGTTALYRVRAKGANGQVSDWSTPLSVTTP